jgi:hypothetical protein
MSELAELYFMNLANNNLDNYNNILNFSRRFISNNLPRGLYCIKGGKSSGMSLFLQSLIRGSEYVYVNIPNEKRDIEDLRRHIHHYTTDSCYRVFIRFRNSLSENPQSELMTNLSKLDNIVIIIPPKISHKAIAEEKGLPYFEILLDNQFVCDVNYCHLVGNSISVIKNFLQLGG